ncbi:MAG TPA: immunoglobulin domain-containing protein [Verrucomicrobiae bacterium]|nr:immunoglobulin domain-containing protein [Verrucomicrobiae bacterium]
MNKISILGVAGISLLCMSSASAVSPNDSFSNRVQLLGTNLTYSGTFGDATLEPGEPHPYGTNTVWVSWAAPATGAVQVSLSPNLPGQFAQYPPAVFTGSTVDHLQAVPSVPVHSFLPDPVRFVAMEGVVYQFQLTGPQVSYLFSLQFQPYGACSCDNFTNAIVIQGDYPTLVPQPVAGATMELGEPAHFGPRPQKSLWWKWQPQQWSACTLDLSSSLVSNYVTAVYVGNSVDTLSLVAKATNTTCNFTAEGGETYYIAAAVPTNAVGDIWLFLQNPKSLSSHTPNGNVLYEPSWEGTALYPVHWQSSGPIGGWVNDYGGVDGMTWPELAGGTAIWQDFPTIPGHRYAVRFAVKTGSNRNSGETGDAFVAVAWDDRQLGTSDIPEAEISSWSWDNNYSVIASNITSRIAFTNVGRTIQMDAFSVVDVSDPPVIVTQPASASSVAGGSVTLAVGVTGTGPLHYQWYFQGTLLDDETSSQLDLTSLSTNQIGDYRVVITNNFGMVTSAVASLLVDVPKGATILFEPYGDTVPAGNDFNFTVVATGTPPLGYQWFFNGTNIDGATNQNLTLTNVQSVAAGVYSVRVQDLSSTVWSLPATLVVGTADSGGGQINFANWFVDSKTNALPIFDVDGSTLLNGGGYVAQLYAGPALASLRPVGQPTPFQSGFNAGYFVPQTLTLGNVAPGSNVMVQVRAWDTAFGPSYEAARAMGGRFGKSPIFQVVAGGNEAPPADLQGLQSFSLQAGLPYLQVASITFVERQPPDTLVWALHGQPGNIYTIEKREQGAVWQPYQVITNVTGTVNFTNTVEPGSGFVVLYRARILD